MGKRYRQVNVNPKSLENLTHDGRTPKWGENKKRHQISVTDRCWQHFEALAEANECSVSEVLEKLARDWYLHPIRQKRR